MGNRIVRDENRNTLLMGVDKNKARPLIPISAAYMLCKDYVSLRQRSTQEVEGNGASSGQADVTHPY